MITDTHRWCARFHTGPTALSLLVLSIALVLPDARAQELKLEDVKTYRPSFEYEQCANACQMVLDKSASVCMNAALEAKQEVDGACLSAATETNDSCLKACPVDTGDPRALGLTAE